MQHIRYLVARLLEEQWPRFTLLVIATALAGLLEGVGVAAIVPLMQIIEKGRGASTGHMARIVGAALKLVGLPFALLGVLAFILGFILASQVLILAQQKLLSSSTVRFEARLRSRLFDAVMDAGWPLFLRTKSGDLVSRLSIDTVRAGYAYMTLVQMLSTLIIVFVYVGVAVTVSWQMTLAVAVTSLCVVVLLRRRAAHGTRYGRTLTETDAEIMTETQENVAAAKLVKAYAAQDEIERRFAHLTSRRGRTQYKNMMNQAWLSTLYNSATISSVFIGIYLAVTHLGMTSGNLVVFLFVFYRLSPRISNIQANYSQVLSFIPGLREVDSLTATAQAMKEHSGAEPLTAFRSQIDFCDVSFAYSPGTPILEHLDLSIPKGAAVAIVGPSGSGKTTIVDLMMGLLVPNSGEILVDGVPLTNIKLGDWRQRVGYVPQDAAFFHASVKDNIAWGNVNVSLEDIIEAARLAFADDFVAALPEGYDTIIGDRGVRLSGGQRQRLALARAVLRKPDILILDEATSALDAESEDKIQKAVDRLAESTTIVTVTHRLATVRGSSFVYLIENGELVESGSWDELVARRGRFRQLTELQGLGESAIQN